MIYNEAYGRLIQANIGMINNNLRIGNDINTIQKIVVDFLNILNKL